MALRTILTGDDPILYKKSRKIENFDSRLHTLIDDMIHTMKEANGVGLAAVQVGVLRRVVIIGTEEDEILELVNPEVTYKSKELQCGTEGCLSFPGEEAPVIRSNEVTVTAQNRFGEKVTYTGTKLKARCILHEVDHLDGIVFGTQTASEEELNQWTIEDEDGNISYIQPDLQKDEAI